MQINLGDIIAALPKQIDELRARLDELQGRFEKLEDWLQSDALLARVDRLDCECRHLYRALMEHRQLLDAAANGRLCTHNGRAVAVPDFESPEYLKEWGPPS
jgi:hypothetical protein